MHVLIKVIFNFNMQEKKIQLPKPHYTGIKRGELSKPLFI